MYYIYLDETYNLREGSQNQFLAIAGFGTENTKKIAKLYKILKNRILAKRKQGTEIKSTDRLAEKKLRPQLFKKLRQNDLEIYAVWQYKNRLPFRYFNKNTLLYEQFYLNLLAHLLIEKWQFRNQKKPRTYGFVFPPFTAPHLEGTPGGDPEEFYRWLFSIFILY